MPKGDIWTRVEVEACVAAYLRMLMLQLSNQSYSKTEHRRALVPLLDGRSESAVEQKHRNVSAVMIELGYPYVTGYRSLSNYQSLLRDVVVEQVAHNPSLDRAALNAVEQPAFVPLLTRFDQIVVPIPRPARQRVAEVPPAYAPRFVPVQRDYLAREAQNRSLGDAGERFVVEFEARRLHDRGQRVLSERVEQVSTTRGDGLGYDVLSFDEHGRERFIEVKTTSFGDETPFYVSRNEIAFSEFQPDQYHLYRLFGFRQKPQLFDLPGVISRHCDLDPISYLAKLI
ncbi:MAG: DUF3883 domain-containing protein [Rhodanobacter sp.]